MRLTDEQLDWICERVPDAPPQPTSGGRAESGRGSTRSAARG